MRQSTDPGRFHLLALDKKHLGGDRSLRNDMHFAYHRALMLWICALEDPDNQHAPAALTARSKPVIFVSMPGLTYQQHAHAWASFTLYITSQDLKLELSM